MRKKTIPLKELTLAVCGEELFCLIDLESESFAIVSGNEEAAIMNPSGQVKHSEKERNGMVQYYETAHTLHAHGKD